MSHSRQTHTIETNQAQLNIKQLFDPNLPKDKNAIRTLLNALKAFQEAFQGNFEDFINNHTPTTKMNALDNLLFSNTVTLTDSDRSSIMDNLKEVFGANMLANKFILRINDLDTLFSNAKSAPDFMFLLDLIECRLQDFNWRANNIISKHYGSISATNNVPLIYRVHVLFPNIDVTRTRSAISIPYEHFEQGPARPKSAPLPCAFFVDSQPLTPRRILEIQAGNTKKDELLAESDFNHKRKSSNGLLS